MRFFGKVHLNATTVNVVEDVLQPDGRITSRIIVSEVVPSVGEFIVKRLTKMDRDGFKLLAETARCQNCGLYNIAGVYDVSCYRYETDANPYACIPILTTHDFRDNDAN